jgi:hypothetical protein
MKRILALTVFAVLVLGSPAQAAGAGGLKSAWGDSHLVAHDVFGLQTLELQHFRFGAFTLPRGGAVGRFDYRDIEDGAPFDADGRVTCLTVIGRDAWVGGVVERSNDPTVTGLGGWWHVTDNGHGFGSHGTPDVTSFLGVGSLAATQAFCDAHAPYRFAFDIERGGVLVR